MPKHTENEKSCARRYRSDTKHRAAVDAYTSFLPADATPLQRSWHFVNGDRDLKLCSCSKPRKFKPIVYYQETCGDRKCVSRLVKSRRTEPVKSAAPNTGAMREGFIAMMESRGLDELKKSSPAHLGRAFRSSASVRRLILETFVESVDGLPVSMVVSLFLSGEAGPKRCGCGSTIKKPKMDTCGAKSCVTERRAATVMNKYGSGNISASAHYSDIKKKRRVEKYSHIVSPDKILDSDGYFFECLCAECGETYTASQHILRQRKGYGVTLCTVCNPVGSHNDSAGCKEVARYVESLGFRVERNNRSIIKPFELDIVVPDAGVAIEYNGLYHHGNSKSKDYHMNKTEMARAAGYLLVHVWSDDWMHRRHAVEGMIAAKLGRTVPVHARKCQVVEVPRRECSEFLEEHHLQGSVPASRCLGLRVSGDLVMVMTFGARRLALGGGEGVELLRMCTKPGIRVIGGASRLFRRFVDSSDVGEIVSYCDNSRNDGGVYAALKFSLVSEGSPNYWYVDGSRPWTEARRLHRFSFRKDALVSQGFDPAKTESEIMSDRNFYRVYDCGSRKFVWKRDI